MKSRKLMEIMGEIKEEYIAEADPWAERGTRWIGSTKRNAKRCFYLVCAACLCLVIGGIFVGQLQKQDGADMFSDSVTDALLNGQAGGMMGVMIDNDVLYIADVKVGNRLAEYWMSKIYNTQGAGYIPQNISPADSDTFQADYPTKFLEPFLGELYYEEEGRRWYRIKDCDNIARLISQDEDGLLRLWEYSYFHVALKPGTWELGEVGDYYKDRYPDMDLDWSAYTYGEMFSTIYGLKDAHGIKRITAEVTNTDNTLLEKKMGRIAETYICEDEEEIEKIYNIIVDMVCAKTEWLEFAGKRRFTYSFTMSEQLLLGGGESIFGTRNLIIEMEDGTVIDLLKYDAHRGCIYQKGCVLSEDMSEEAVGIFNEIFGIH
ncbi:MAG: hypothetical protein K2N63_09760 [Lachnospiraceae bacterium]|nr:hypothetical protein [Lachnospiraceae bacterium]